MTKENLVFGIRPVIEAIKAGREIEKLLIQSGLKGEGFFELRNLLIELKVPFQYVPVEKLNRVTMKNHQGVICFVSSVIYQPIENILMDVFEQGRVPLFLILDRITDVRNFGAISRTAECVGVDAIIVPAKGSAQINGDAVKTSAGALMKISVCRSENLKTTVEYLQTSGVRVVSCTEKGSESIYDQDYSVPTAIILGSEEDGISSDLIRISDGLAKIPMHGEIASLNVSVSAGVVLYEVIRQRLV
ncbi:MAG: 23S rRNA (guanosine(2251)-2'-O)-methyltransferase RlmB [Bacteroidetes bacterium]|nr:23S rRNA (guanosine(2251)-2'-O)-methyltransferase RlmB [Bacteroidota bacterium]